MEIKELIIPLGVIDPPELVAGQILATGYYYDPSTGQKYYYDAVNNKWYYVAAGYLYPLAISWKPSPSPLLYLLVGDILRFRFSFKYLGDAITGKKFHAAIGEEPATIPPSPGTDFAEIKCVIKAIDIPKCTTPTTITDKYIDVPIPSAAGGETITAYVKWEQLLVTEGISSTPLYYNVAQVATVAGDFSEFKITKFEKG